jgi:hypothetical protein
MPVPNRTSFLLGAVVLAAFVLSGCRPPRVVLGPEPSEIREIEGDASLKIVRSGETSRTRFAFVLEMSRRGRVVVTDFLGGAAAEFVFAGDDGYLVLPTKKVYWKAGPAEIVEKLLGFPLTLDEMAGLICGRWPAGAEDGSLFQRWSFERDGDGRTRAGRKNGLEFTVGEFFPGSRVPRIVDFRDAFGSGRLAVRGIEFNRPGAETAFRLDFLGVFSSKSWEEIAGILRHED